MRREGDDYIVADPSRRFPTWSNTRDRRVYRLRFAANGANEPVPVISVSALKQKPGYVPSVSESPMHAGDRIFYIIMAILLGIAALAGFFVLRVLGKKATFLSESSEYPAGFSSELKTRFPADHIYFVPEQVASFLGVSPESAGHIFNEHWDEWWTGIMALYPLPPRDEDERQQREQEFWQRHAKQFTVSNGAGQASLSPKQEILDYFTHSKNGYFDISTQRPARCIKPSWKNGCAISLSLKTQIAVICYGSAQSRSRVQKDREIEKTTEAEARFTRETLPAHMQKWGEWFFLQYSRGI